MEHAYDNPVDPNRKIIEKYNIPSPSSNTPIFRFDAKRKSLLKLAKIADFSDNEDYSQCEDNNSDNEDAIHYRTSALSTGNSSMRSSQQSGQNSIFRSTGLLALCDDPHRPSNMTFRLFTHVSRTSSSLKLLSWRHK